MSRWSMGLFLILLLGASVAWAGPLAPTDLRVGSLAGGTLATEPGETSVVVGDVLAPDAAGLLMSAIYEDADPDAVAVGYDLEMGTSAGFEAESLLWTADDGDPETPGVPLARTPAGGRTPEITYAGPPLELEHLYHWRLRLYDEAGAAGDWGTGSFQVTRHIAQDATDGLPTEVGGSGAPCTRFGADSRFDFRFAVNLRRTRVRLWVKAGDGFDLDGPGLGLLLVHPDGETTSPVSKVTPIEEHEGWRLYDGVLDPPTFPGEAVKGVATLRVSNGDPSGATFAVDDISVVSE